MMSLRNRVLLTLCSVDVTSLFVFQDPGGGYYFCYSTSSLLTAAFFLPYLKPCPILCKKKVGQYFPTISLEENTQINHQT
mmetsp:Transcript_18153/g.26497  ORF Transcript_18153/g.26497 Transcript_18153/m.26497 type:complete len:80 (-) Transcript_18153:65-304(-)